MYTILPDTGIGNTKLDPERIEFYRSMSNFELNEIVLLYNAAFSNQLTVFSSILFAYIAAAYLVGSKLSRFQMWSITLIYCVFEIFNIIGLFIIATSLIVTSYVLREIDISIVLYATGIACILAWIMSIIFMLQTRHAKDT